MAPNDFEGYDEPANVSTDSEDALKPAMESEIPAEDVIEPVLDE
jgi:hypothetical protein